MKLYSLSTFPPALMLMAVLVFPAENASAQWRRGAKDSMNHQEAVLSAPAVDATGVAIPAGEAGCPTERHFRTIVGSWLTTADGGGASEPFKALATFSADGNVIFVTQGEAAGNPLFTAEHGVWGCIGSRYTFTFLEINYNPDGSFAGIFKVRANIGLHPSGDEIEVRLVFEFRDANGNLQQTGTGTGTGKRIKLEPLG
jgi:hypothetical protein